ncbi:MAG: hypothetical protein JW838_11765 [Spirochaetes bacterium]|nr:hypothetical protein [Spirochaetota bacterium]
MALQKIERPQVQPGAIEKYAKFNKEQVERNTTGKNDRAEEPKAVNKGWRIDTKA